LSPGYAKFYIFLREIAASTSIAMRILNPNGSPFNSWNYTIPTFYKTSYWGFSKLLPTIDGTYTFDATYNGVTCSKTFTIVHSLGINNVSNDNSFKVFPNPTNNVFNVTADGIDNGNYTFTLTNLAGQVVENQKMHIETNTLEKSFSVGGLSEGVYFLIIDGEKTRTVKKIVKQF